MPWKNPQNFATQELKKVESEDLKGKTEDMECKAMASVLELVEKRGALKLEDVLQHLVTSEWLYHFQC